MNLTLGKNYILRRIAQESFQLFNTLSAVEYQISKELYFTLKIFKHNAISKGDVYTYLKNKGVNFSIDKFDVLLQKPDFSNLLVFSDQPNSLIEEIDLYDFPSFVENSPSRVDLVLTEKCNLQCKHCFQESSPLNPMDFSPINALISLCDELEGLNIQALKITGGEPLIYPHINELLSHLANKNYAKIILSNGILINDTLIDIVKEKNFRFTISLDGESEKSHEFLRGKNTFHKTIKSLKKLSKYKIPFSITTTVHKYNYSEVRKICEFTHTELGVKKHGINIMLPMGRGNKNNSLCLTIEESNFVKNEIAKLSSKFGKEFNIYINDDSELLTTGSATSKVRCNAGTKLIALSPQLGVYPCVYGIGVDEFEMGKVGKEKLIDIWRKNSWSAFRGGVNLDNLPECRSCSFKNKCGLKNCRLKPISQGKDFFAAVSYCKKNELKNLIL